MELEQYIKKRNNLVGSLLRDIGITNKFEVISLAGEGKELPNGLESESGWLLLDDERLFSFWLDWDEDKIASDGSRGNYTLGDHFRDSEGGPYPLFREINKEDIDVDDKRYVFARKKIGLPLSERQEEVLQKALEDNPELQEELKK